MKTLIWIIVILIILIGGYFLLEEEKIEEKETIKIGAVLPLTGNLSVNGEDYRVALEILEEKTNKEGGINGREIEIIFEDGEGDSKKSLSASNKLISSDGVNFILAAFRNPSYAIKSLTESKNVLLVTNTGVSGEKFDGGNNLSFLLSNDIKAEGTMLGEILNDFQCNNTAHIFPDLETTNWTDSAIKESFNGNLLSYTYPVGEKDFRTILAKIKSEEVDCLIPEAYPIEASAIFRQTKELGLDDKKMFFSSILESFNYLEMAPEGFLENSIYVFPKFYPELSDSTEKYFNEYSKKTDKEPFLFGAILYEGGEIMLESMKRCDEISVECVSKEMRKLDYVGIIGNKAKRMDDNLNILYGDLYTKTVKEGEFIEYKE